MTILYHLANVLLIGSLIYLLWRGHADAALKKYFLPALILKLVCGILLSLFYQKYFGGGDANVFQTQSEIVTEYAKVSPASYVRLLLTRKFESETLRASMIFYWHSNSYFMVMLLSFLNFVTNSHHYLNSLYFSLFSFFGLWQLSVTAVKINPKYEIPVVLAFLFFPSVVFWSSGISKEAIYLGSLCWLVAVVLRLVHHHYDNVWLEIIQVIMAAYLLWKIKFYFAALVFALLFSYALYVYLIRNLKIFKKRKAKWLLYCCLLLVSGAIVSRWHDVFELDFFFLQLMLNYTTLSEWSAGKPALSYPQLEPTITSLIRHSPEAVLNASLRPFIWEGKSMFYLIAGAENLIIIVLLLFTIFNIIRNYPVPLTLEAIVILIYIIIIATLVGLSTPNIGSLSRYKIAFTPFLIFLLINFNYNSKKRYTGF